MHNGFSYNGVHCSSLGCYYAPAPDELFTQPGIKVKSSEVDGRNGGYFHSASYKSRVFKLKCYFEDLTAAGIYKIISWLSKDSAGKLVFDDRPNVYYEVRPTAQFSPTTYTCRHDWMNQVVYSGTFTAEFTAYFPFGYMTRTSYDDADECGESNYSGILPSSMMPEVPGAQALTKERTSFLIYNPGTQPCCLNFEIKTDNLPNGSTIRNITNGTKYVFTGTGNNPGSITVKVDGDTGRTYRQGASLVWIDANELHDEGYVTLEPYGVLYQMWPRLQYLAQQRSSYQVWMPQAIWLDYTFGLVENG